MAAPKVIYNPRCLAGAAATAACATGVVCGISAGTLAGWAAGVLRDAVFGMLDGATACTGEPAGFAAEAVAEVALYATALWFCAGAGGSGPGSA
jgi:hypothetical protein